MTDGDGIEAVSLQGGKITVAQAAELAGTSEQTIRNRLKANGGDIEAAIRGKAYSAEEAAVDDIMDALGMSEATNVIPPKPILPTILPPAEKRDTVATAQAEAPAEDRVPVWKADLRRLNAAIEALEELEENGFDDDGCKDRMRDCYVELLNMRATMYGGFVNWREIAK